MRSVLHSPASSLHVHVADLVAAPITYSARNDCVFGQNMNVTGTYTNIEAARKAMDKTGHTFVYSLSPVQSAKMSTNTRARAGTRIFGSCCKKGSACRTQRFVLASPYLRTSLKLSRLHIVTAFRAFRRISTALQRTNQDLG